jgi:hypothetical protein
MSIVGDQLIYEPDRRLGVIFHFSAISGLIIISGWGIWNAARSSLGLVFLLYLIPSLVSFVLIPLLAYRWYSLMGAYYQLDRDGMRLRWGLRIEDIPMDAVTWISLSTALKRELPMPWLRWPGAVLGTRHTSDGERVEFLSSRSNQLVVIATRTQLFTISPGEPETFMQTFQRLMELGSLSPITAQSLHPTFLLARIWRMRSARLLILAGLLLNIILVVWVSLVIPSRSTILFGFATSGDPVPAVRLLLIPLISGFFFLVDLLLGIFFFRRDADPAPTDRFASETFTARSTPDQVYNTDQQADASTSKLAVVFWNLRWGVSLIPGQYLAHLLWGSSALVSSLFILATFFILSFSD